MSYNRIQKIKRNFYSSRIGRSTPSSESTMIVINIGGWKRGKKTGQYYRIIES